MGTDPRATPPTGSRGSPSTPPTGSGASPTGPRASLATVLREWTRIGVTGFGGPPAHIALLRDLVVERRGGLDARSFEDANAACGLLPGPASTQLAIYCAYRVAGTAGAIVGGLGFIVPAVIAVIAVSSVLFGQAPPLWIRGAGAGAGAAVPAVALQAARGLVGPSLDRARERTAVVWWAAYLVAGVTGAVLAGPYLALVLVACGGVELVRRHGGVANRLSSIAALPFGIVGSGGVGALAWTALKVGALSFGGGFVIIPLMQGDAVHTYHWMTNGEFLNAVALGQVTPGPVVATVAAVGYAAHGVAGGAMAATIAFLPSFLFILIFGRHFERLRENPRPRAFLDGAGPAAIGAIGGAAITLAIVLSEAWQFAVLAAAVVALLVLRRGVVTTLLAAGLVGTVAALAGAPLP
jgi:chromate transporter